jgi:hypothetical protein
VGIKLSIGLQADVTISSVVDFSARVAYINLLGYDNNGWVYPGSIRRGVNSYTQMGSKYSLEVLKIHKAVYNGTWEGRFNAEYCDGYINDKIAKYFSYSIPNSNLANGFPIVVQWGNIDGESFFRYGQNYSVSLIGGFEAYWWNYIKK